MPVFSIFKKECYMKDTHSGQSQAFNFKLSLTLNRLFCDILQDGE